MKYALFLALCSCATLNRAGMATSVALTACDWRQTRTVAAAGWAKTEAFETNPILGRSPTTSTLDVYMIDVVLFSLVAYEVLPEKYRALVWIPLGVIEADSIRNNESFGWSCAR